MPLPFTLVCDLLEQCNDLCQARKKNTRGVVDWFARHRGRIDAHDTNLAALLSTLLPEKRTDRVYCIQASSLERIIGRALILGSSRLAELALYKKRGLGFDLADCVERILTVTPNPVQTGKFQVTVEEIDDLFHGIASRIKWSSPAIRASGTPVSQRDRSDLESFYRRLAPKEAKWFTRLVLKDYQPLIFDSYLIYRLCDPVLPSILQIRDDFAAAIQVIQAARSKLLPDSARPALAKAEVLGTVKPKLGIKVGRQQWFKGRSIKHCMDMGHGRMSVESKIDGEYCQIHIDVSKGRNGVQIFSKSGKDSTEDRLGLHGVILDSLKVGRADSIIREQCILEGELVVYSDTEHKIMPFHKIRKYVTRRGRFLGSEQDSQRRPWEHLMIIYYDILLLDDASLLNVFHSERFRLLQKAVHTQKGRAELVQRQVIDFGHRFGASGLRKAFAKTVWERGEGLVLKPDTPYFYFRPQGSLVSGCCIKLKKEYIGNFGDVGDFAVVGAGFDPAKAKTCGIPNVKWTHFYLGCLENKEEIKRWDAVPEFTVVNVVELNETLLKALVTVGNPTEVPLEENRDTKLSIQKGVETMTPMTVAFTNPPVFDLRCFSFDRAGNTGFWSLRFPVVSKIHFDRDFSDTISFQELQDMARDATTAPDLEDSQENLAWIAKLEGADPRGVAVDAVSQLTATTMATPSLQERSQGSTTWSGPFSPATTGSVSGQSQGMEELQVPTSQPRAFAVPALPLITPPTSSAPVEPSSSQDSGVNERKRSAAVATSESPACKRRKSTELQSPISRPPVRRGSKSQTRRPLEDRDANASQRPLSSGGSFGDEPPKRGSQVAAEPGIIIQPTIEPDLTQSEDSEEERRPSQGWDDTTTLAVEEEEAKSSQRGDPTSVSVSIVVISDDEDDSSQLDSRESIITECKYAGSNCRVAKSLILLSPECLEHSTASLALFKAHGIAGAGTNVEEWMRTDNQRAMSDEIWESGPSKVLLVDSVRKNAEMKSLLSKMEAARKDLPEGRRDWITVYDWRVLEHLAILEDESLGRKYYDGFYDPWRRWYCGLV